MRGRGKNKSKTTKHEVESNSDYHQGKLRVWDIMQNSRRQVIQQQTSFPPSENKMEPNAQDDESTKNLRVRKRSGDESYSPDLAHSQNLEPPSKKLKQSSFNVGDLAKENTMVDTNDNRMKDDKDDNTSLMSSEISDTISSADSATSFGTSQSEASLQEKKVKNKGGRPRKRGTVPGTKRGPYRKKQKNPDQEKDSRKSIIRTRRQLQDEDDDVRPRRGSTKKNRQSISKAQRRRDLKKVLKEQRVEIKKVQELEKKRQKEAVKRKIEAREQKLLEKIRKKEEKQRKKEEKQRKREEKKRLKEKARLEKLAKKKNASQVEKHNDRPKRSRKVRSSQMERIRKNLKKAHIQYEQSDSESDDDDERENGEDDKMKDDEEETMHDDKKKEDKMSKGKKKKREKKKKDSIKMTDIFSDDSEETIEEEESDESEESEGPPEEENVFNVPPEWFKFNSQHRFHLLWGFINDNVLFQNQYKTYLQSLGDKEGALLDETVRLVALWDYAILNKDYVGAYNYFMHLKQLEGFEKLDKQLVDALVRNMAKLEILDFLNLNADTLSMPIYHHWYLTLEHKKFISALKIILQKLAIFCGYSESAAMIYDYASQLSERDLSSGNRYRHQIWNGIRYELSKHVPTPLEQIFGEKPPSEEWNTLLNKLALLKRRSLANL